MFPDAFAFRIVFPISTVPPQTPPQIAAELPVTVLFKSVTELAPIPPAVPLSGSPVELPLIVLFTIVRLPSEIAIPPPAPDAELPLIVLLRARFLEIRSCC